MVRNKTLFYYPSSEGAPLPFPGWLSFSPEPSVLVPSSHHSRYNWSKSHFPILLFHSCSIGLRFRFDLKKISAVGSLYVYLLLFVLRHFCTGNRPIEMKNDLTFNSGVLALKYYGYVCRFWLVNEGMWLANLYCLRQYEELSKYSRRPSDDAVFDVQAMDPSSLDLVMLRLHSLWMTGLEKSCFYSLQIFRVNI